MRKMLTENQEHLVASNKEYARHFTSGHLPIPPAKRYLVVTCMDARIPPMAAYGIELGDAHVIRNAGGNARDAYRSILISQHMLGTTEILLIKHTQCGLRTFTNEQGRKLVNEHQGHEVCGPDFDFQPFNDLEGSVREDVKWLKKCGGVVEGGVVSGWVYQCEDGKVKHIC
ncbi:hypothetical protein LTR56_015032 [Elasticomyces elasticus]|nr:hypothetical protein LTR56_015032 [Elasticomyces elasticus]KAK3646996.1 hypothetical protein LTR22_014023 [Elasticomyces elasticus]KAK4916929.1 hypothetical protein LTR49_015104 [Elasticomyces elasticus]KAK5754183.1 hypothetical protein LTS12_015711 [Elasticomyces elasticus]